MKRRIEKKIRKKENTYNFISAYAVSRMYGGSEEGGWYYDHYDYIEGLKAPTDIRKKQAEQKLHKWYDHYQQVGYRRDGSTYKLNRFSSIGDGEDLEILREKELGENQSHERPRYE